MQFSNLYSIPPGRWIDRNEKKKKMPKLTQFSKISYYIVTFVHWLVRHLGQSFVEQLITIGGFMLSSQLVFNEWFALEIP